MDERTWADSAVMLGQYEKKRDQIAIRAGVRGIENLLNLEHDALHCDVTEFARRGGEIEEALELVAAAAPQFVANLKAQGGTQLNMFDQSKDSTPSTAAAYLEKTTTMTGVPLNKIYEALNQPWDSLEDIPSFQRVKGKSPKPALVAKRVNQIFGMEGYGWRFAELPQTTVHYEEAERPSANKNDFLPLFIVRVEMYVFEYCTISPAGRLEWIRTSPISDLHENERRRAAYTGAMSSLLKQAVRRLGGFDSITVLIAQEKANAKANQENREDRSSTQPPKPPAQGTGLTETEVKELVAWGAKRTLTVPNIQTALGIKNRDEWTKGLDAAKARVSEWLGKQTVQN